MAEQEEPGGGHAPFNPMQVTIPPLVWSRALEPGPAASGQDSQLKWRSTVTWAVTTGRARWGPDVNWGQSDAVTDTRKEALVALALANLGTVHEGPRRLLEPERIRAYAAATNDDNPAYWSGNCAPPIFGVVPSWEPIRSAVADMVPSQAMDMIVHGEQDMHFHRPLVPGSSLVTRAAAHSVRVGPSGTRCTVRADSRDSTDGEAVLEQYVTIVVRGLTGGTNAGTDKPGHAFPEPARAAPIGCLATVVDLDQTSRYRDASGDDSLIHVDETFARSVGLPGVIVHGLCTMAMASQAVIELAAGGDPGRVRRVAARFAKMVLPGTRLSTTVYDAGERNGRAAVAFESLALGLQGAPDKVITNGWAEVAR